MADSSRSEYVAPVSSPHLIAEAPEARGQDPPPAVAAPWARPAPVKSFPCVTGFKSTETKYVHLLARGSDWEVISLSDSYWEPRPEPHSQLQGRLGVPIGDKEMKSGLLRFFNLVAPEVAARKKQSLWTVTFFIN